MYTLEESGEQAILRKNSGMDEKTCGGSCMEGSA